THRRLYLQQLQKSVTRHGGNLTARQRLHARGPEIAVDSSVLPKDVARTQFGKAHDLAGKRVDGDANLPFRNEKHIVRGVAIFNNPLFRFVMPPGTLALNLLQDIWSQTSQQRNPA